MKKVSSKTIIGVLTILFFSWGSFAKAQIDHFSLTNQLRVDSVDASENSLVRVGSVKMHNNSLQNTVSVISQANSGAVKIEKSGLLKTASANIHNSRVSGSTDLTMTAQNGIIRIRNKGEVNIASLDIGGESVTESRFDNKTTGAGNYINIRKKLINPSITKAVLISNSTESSTWKREAKEISLHTEITRTAITDGTEKQVGITLYKDSYTKTFGYQNDYVKVGNVDLEYNIGTFGYNSKDNNYTLSPMSLGGAVSAVQVGIEKELIRNTLSGELHAEFASANAQLTPLEFSVADNGAKLYSEVGAEAYLGKVDAGFELSITPVTVWGTLFKDPFEHAGDLLSSTTGSVDHYFGAGDLSEYIGDFELPDLPEYLDHGLVVGVCGEAGVGAFAKADAGAEVSSDFVGIYASAKAGLGVGGGLCGQVGVR